MPRRTTMLMVLSLAAAGCSRTLDTAGLEEQVATILRERAGIEVGEVSCPEDVEVEAGLRFECQVSGEDGDWVVQVTQTDDEGNVDIEFVDAAA